MALDSRHSVVDKFHMLSPPSALNVTSTSVVGSESGEENQVSWFDTKIVSTSNKKWLT